jgi:hypothetical protein
MDKKYDGSPAEFLERATNVPADLGALAVNGLKAILAGQGPFRLRAHFTINVTDLVDTSRDGYLDLTVITSAPDLAEAIIAADTAGKLRAENREVLVRADFFIQTRVVLFIEDRVVGQLYAAADGRSLQLDISELPETWDIGNRLLSYVNPDTLPFKVHLI